MNTNHVVAIGENRSPAGGITSSQYYFISCYGLSTGYTPMLSVGDFDATERYDDLLLTDNYVVFMGYDSYPNLDAMCYRKANPYNIFSPMFDSIHFFINGNDPMSYTHSTVMPEDKIATSYWSVNSNNDFVTRIRMIDIQIDANYNTQEYVIPSKIEPIDMVYIPYDNSLVLMEDFNLQYPYTQNTSFVFLDPSLYSTYNTGLEYKKDEYFQSMTTLDNIYYLAGAGASWFLRYKILSPTNTPDDDCPIVKKIDVEIGDNLDMAKIYRYCIDYPRPSNDLSVNRTVATSQVTIICNNQ